MSWVEIAGTETAQVAQAAPICSGLWAAVRGGAGETYDFSRIGTTALADIQCCGTVNQYQSITRIIFAFPTTSLSATSKPERNAYIRLKASGAPVVTLAGHSIILTDAAPADPALMVYTDYALVGSTAYSSAVALTSITDGLDMRFFLNSTGINALAAAIAAQTPFCVGLRIQADQTNTEPTWASGVRASQAFYTSAHATAAFRPVLSPTGGVQIALTGTLANAGDTVTADMWAVEVFT